MVKVPVAFELQPDLWIPILWLCEEEMGDDHGTYTYDLNGGYIKMNKSTPVRHMDMVLLHEIRHAYMANCGYSHIFKTLDMEEAVNEFLDFSLRGIVKINDRSKRFKWRSIDL